MAQVDPKIIEAIAFFEDMLQNMPKDKTALEFLAVAYEQTDQKDKRRDILVRLVDVLLMEGDYKNAKAIAEHLRSFTEHMPAMLAIERVAALAEMEEASHPAQAEAATSPGAAFVPAKPTKEWPNDIHSISHGTASAEMDMVWSWHDHAHLPKEICMEIMNTLTDRPMTDTPLLVSALAILDELHPEYTDKLMENMQQANDNIPALPLELFEPTPAALKTLPLLFCQVNGVLPLALMGNELLVAILNPGNEELQQEIRDRAGRVCHFFMVHPRGWQPVFEKFMGGLQKDVSP